MTATKAEHLLREVLTRTWQAEPELVRFVKTNLARPVPDDVVRTALDLLAARGLAEARKFPGYPHLHWRKA